MRIRAFERIQPLNAQAILRFFDQAVAEGTLIGQGPGRSAPNRLKALRNQLRGLNARPRRGRTHPACGLLEAMLRQLDTDSPNAFVAGPAMNELTILLKSWGNELSCL